MLSNIRVGTRACDDLSCICKVNVYFLHFLIIYKIFAVFFNITHARTCRYGFGMPSRVVLKAAGNTSWRRACSALR